MMTAEIPGAENRTEPGADPAAPSRPSLSWAFPPAVIRLEAGQTHVWCAAMSAFEQQLDRLSNLLSGMEKKRAARFRFGKDRNRYIIRHGILRLLLSRYLDCAPGDVEFRYGPKGKPEIRDGSAGFHFNDSHSENLALYALTRVCPIGADVELVRPIPGFEKIAARYFSRREAGIMRALPLEKRMEAFYACWTRKEAFLKATGEGIGYQLADVEVTLAPGDEAEVLRVPGESQAAAGWKLQAFSPAPGYLGAIALQGAIDSVCYWAVPIFF
jgi:4'-phosphopantetheinyl transferase